MQDATREATTLRKLREKSGVSPPYLEQFHTFGDANRDKRGWSVTVCYTAQIACQACGAHISSVTDVQWVAPEQLKNLPLAFDHAKIIDQADLLPDTGEKRTQGGGRPATL